jgi:succinoglycan biosynthesis transport protein ExoP
VAALQPHDANESSELKELLGVMQRRKWTICVIFLLVLAVVLTFSYRQRAMYTAQSRVLVEPETPDPSGVPQAPSLQTETQIVASEPVGTRVVEELGLETDVRSLLDSVGVQALEETTVLVISFSSPDPSLAAAAANSFAENYIDYRHARAQQMLAAERQRTLERIAQVQRRLTDKTKQLQNAIATDDGVLQTALEGQRNVFITRLAFLQQQLDELQPEGADGGVGSEIIEAAQVPTSPSSPNHRRDLALGSALGLMLGIGTALIRERLDDRFRGRADLTQATEAPVLATVPRFEHLNKKQGGTPIVAAEPQSNAAESYRTLRTNLDFAMLQRGSKLVLITSPSAGEGKTVTATNLGVAAAQAGGRVLLVSTDLRRPTIEKYFDITNDVGISNLLIGQVDAVSRVVRRTSFPNIDLLPSGPVPPNPAELLSSPRLHDTLAALEGDYDLILLDSAPVLPVADATILASRVQSTVLVVSASSTRRAAAVHAREGLQKVGAEVIGSVLNHFDMSSSSYGYENYYYYYYSPYSSTGATPGGAMERPHPNGSARPRTPFFRR